VDSAEFRQRAPRVQLSDDPDTANQQTVQEMCRQIHQAAGDPLVQAAAVNAVRSFRGGPSWSGRGITDQSEEPQIRADSCWWWCKHFLRFKHHGAMFEAWSADLGDPRTKLQLLIAPDVLVRMRSMEGDCAIYTMMVCAMLEALGLTWQICTGAVDRNQPDIFSHVWARVVLPGGPEALDASHGLYPGWQVPARDIYRLKVWDSGGLEVAQQGRFTGLHAYRRRGMGAVVCDEESGVCADNGVTSTSETTDLSSYCSLYPSACSGVTNSGAITQTPASYVAPSSNSAQWATFASNLLKSGLTLAEINSIQPGTVVSANGAILRQSTGYSVPVGSSTALATSLGISSGTLMIGGLALAALFLFTKGK
jgi:hypothetical protein